MYNADGREGEHTAGRGSCFRTTANGRFSTAKEHCTGSHTGAERDLDELASTPSELRWSLVGPARSPFALRRKSHRLQERKIQIPALQLLCTAGWLQCSEAIFGAVWLWSGLEVAFASVSNARCYIHGTSTGDFIQHPVKRTNNRYVARPLFRVQLAKVARLHACARKSEPLHTRTLYILISHRRIHGCVQLLPSKLP